MSSSSRPRSPSIAVVAMCVVAPFGIFLASCIFAAEGDWSNNVASAMKQAAAEKKDLLIDFTGSDWCTWCIRLRQEVFEKDLFKKEAIKKFVLVELDFPNDKTKLSAETIKQNEEWQTRLGVAGFPSVFLTDEKGVPYAQTGYQEGGPEPYMTHLAELAQIRVKRDAALAKAAKSEGLARAKNLDEALSVLEEELAMAHYEGFVKEILALDASNEAGLKKKYAGLMSARLVRKELQAISQEFDGENGKAILKRFDALVSEHKPTGELLLQLLMLKSQILQSMERGDEAVAILDSLIADESIEGPTRMQCMLQKALVLAETKKTDAAIKAFDELIAADKSPLRLRVMVMKAQVLVEAGRKDEAAKSFDAAAAASTDAELKKQILQLRDQSLKNEPASEPLPRDAPQKPAAK